MRPNRGDMVVGKWGARLCGRRLPCAIGRGGIHSTKAEGDGVTPAGIWRLVGGGFRPDRMASTPAAFLRPLGLCDIWSDDVADPDYNHGLRLHDHPFSHEKLRRADRLYDIVLFSDWNWPNAVPGGGSAIFVHNWRRPRYPTEGCIAFAPEDLRWILARWSRRSRIFVI